MLEVEIPAQGHRAILELRCRSWVPRQLNPESHDDRVLGVSVYFIEMATKDAEDRIFLVNQGEWED